MARIEIKSVADSPKPKNGGGDYDFYRTIECGPDKWYKSVVLKADVVPAKTSGKPMLQAMIGLDGNDGGLAITHRVMEPLNATSQRQRFFRAIGMLACHVEGAGFDTDELVGLELLAKPRIKKGTNGYSDSYEIGDMKPILGDNEISRRFKKEPTPDETGGDETGGDDAGGDDAGGDTIAIDE